MDDSALWQRSTHGDEGAFTQLFERHASSVWNHCYRLTGSWAQAEDLTSGTFLTAWRRKKEVTLVRESALPWLYTVAANLARTEHRGSARRLRLLKRIPEPAHVPDHAEAVAEQVDGEERMRLIAGAVRALPKSQRRVVELCLLGELPATDAAQVLGVSEVTVRAHLSRARAQLRKALEESE
ncbi:RNA polymerase sigma factor [Amycolatopsis sp. NPDC059657]|uniref:RNA polymerase sigma factor n=1 Tax=Amycolatopsis sp. NPDC059657 TaxID=3346899 RepID=UPI00367023C2